EDAVVVNNNAAAVLLTLAAHAAGREVIVSRGELVEIGGGFRVPDVMRMSGARLVEVGTTNKTRAADYREALTADTGLLLKVHRSNFAQVGFVEDASLVALAELARERGVPLFYDAGSGALATNRLHGEVPVEKLLDDGVDLVSFSGDKLLGGPQVGIIAGRAGCIAPLRKHPLLRALRPDKLVLAALIETLRLWRDAPSKIPVVRMLATTPDELHARATSICSALQVANKGIKARVAATSAKVGGGASPLCSVESRAVVLEGRPPEALARTLRDGPVPVVGRIEDDEVWLDVIAIDPHDDPQLIRAVMHAYGTFHG
ncbi:MAG: L-seryl-tRNA(Sec) selenium transferase, partial [Myxococcota bacterium]